ncbi:MAG: hypothetical protein LBE84_06300 [Planctomycetota bacterium]|jgi:hypothetical protein|nr:hypothetical protein [Planctomycetota bacterium]
MLHGPRALIQYRLWEEKCERKGAKGEWWLQARSEHAHILSRIGVFGRDRTRDLLLSATAPYSPLFRAAGLLRLGDRPEAFPPGLLDGARRILAVGSAAAAFREWKVLDDREMTILRGG